MRIFWWLFEKRKKINKYVALNVVAKINKWKHAVERKRNIVYKSWVTYKWKTTKKERKKRYCLVFTRDFHFRIICIRHKLHIKIYDIINKARMKNEVHGNGINNFFFISLSLGFVLWTNHKNWYFAAENLINFYAVRTFRLAFSFFLSYSPPPVFIITLINIFCWRKYVKNRSIIIFFSFNSVTDSS